MRNHQEDHENTKERKNAAVYGRQTTNRHGSSPLHQATCVNFSPIFQRTKSPSYGAETAKKVDTRKWKVDQIREEIFALIFLLTTLVATFCRFAPPAPTKKDKVTTK